MCLPGSALFKPTSPHLGIVHVTLFTSNKLQRCHDRAKLTTGGITFLSDLTPSLFRGVKDTSHWAGDQ